MTVLFFEYDLTGHHMEYLHHYYSGALEHRETTFVFYVPEEFVQKKKLYEWEDAEHISFKYFTKKEISECQSANLLLDGWKKSKLLKQKIKEIKADKVFLTTLTVFIPFICLMLCKSAKVSGILYYTYIHNENLYSRLRLIVEKLRYRIAVRSKCIESAFVLNDDRSSKDLCDVYHTDKFRSLADPVPDIKDLEFADLRTQLAIPLENDIYLHFGGMAKRKGTLDILRAINLSQGEEMRHKTFIFAGKIYDEIRAEFYSLLERAKEISHIIVFDEFCSYELLYDLCYTSDYYLMPYHITHLSSGVLGYASIFGKCVIGPSEGLIGYLISNNGLGITLSDVSSETLYEVICEDKKERYHYQADAKVAGYASRNNIKHFTQSIFDVIN